MVAARARRDEGGRDGQCTVQTAICSLLREKLMVELRVYLWHAYGHWESLERQKGVLLRTKRYVNHMLLSHFLFEYGGLSSRHDYLAAILFRL